MGGRASLLDGPQKGTRPNKRNVTESALNVINNKSQLSETDLAARMDVVETSVWRQSTSIYVNHSLVSGLLLLREAINLSENSVTQAQTKEHFGDVEQVLRQMSLIRLVLMDKLQKMRAEFTYLFTVFCKYPSVTINTAPAVLMVGNLIYLSSLWLFVCSG